jgi:hypothetical protein
MKSQVCFLAVTFGTQNPWVAGLRIRRSRHQLRGLITSGLFAVFLGTGTQRGQALGLYAPVEQRRAHRWRGRWVPRRRQGE